MKKESKVMKQEMNGITAQLNGKICSRPKEIQRKLDVTKPCKPITITIVSQIQQLLAKKSNSYHNRMLWRACCLAYFGFLRSSEFTSSSQTNFDTCTHLSLADMAVDSKIMLIIIKHSKTDQLQYNKVKTFIWVEQDTISVQ